VPSANDLPTKAWWDLAAMSGRALLDAGPLVIVPPRPPCQEPEPNLIPFPSSLLEALEQGLVVVVLIPSWGKPAAEWRSDNDAREWALDVARTLTGFDLRDLPYEAMLCKRKFEGDNPLLMPGLSRGVEGSEDPRELDPYVEVVRPKDLAYEPPSTVFWRDNHPPGAGSSLWFRRGRGRVELLLFRQESLPAAVDDALRVARRDRREDGDRDGAMEPPPWSFPARRTPVVATAPRDDEVKPSDLTYDVVFADGRDVKGVTKKDLPRTVAKARVVVDLDGGLDLGRNRFVAVARAGKFTAADHRKGRVTRSVVWLLTAWIYKRGQTYSQDELRRILWPVAQREVRRRAPSESDDPLGEGTLRQYLTGMRKGIAEDLLDDSRGSDGHERHALREPRTIALVRRTAPRAK
jgi:hypothetical protein